MKRIEEPVMLVVFGASGDLACRKLIPALYHLAYQNLLPPNFTFLGFARTKYSDEEYRELAREGIEQYGLNGLDDHIWHWFSQGIFYQSGNYDDLDSFKKLADRIAKLEKQRPTNGNQIYYLATPPSVFEPITTLIYEVGLCREDMEGGQRRIIIEKPFGHDLASARALNIHLLKLFREDQIYRIDHYLGKETVQNILVFRFGNSIFEPIWNRNYIDHVQVTVAERLGVEQRGGYYDTAGALRDMIPNHIFQLVTLTAMEPPISFEANAVRDEQSKILCAIQPFSPEDVLHKTVRGQYGDGVLETKKKAAYRTEPNVKPTSNTETFAALKLSIDNWRWAGVPFYVRTGKRMAAKHSEIVIQFKKAPFMLFRDTPIERLTTNRIVIHIQPDEGITLHFGAKIPGPIVNMGPVDMDFNYVDHFGDQISTGYERLLFDCMTGDATLFQRADMVEASWSIVSPILDVWQAIPARDFPNYESGSWGPTDSDELLEEDARKWKNTID